MTTRTQVRSARAAAVALLATLGLAGCGAAAPGLPPEQPVASTTEGSLAALDRAENDLALALGGRAPAGGLATAAPAQPGYAAPPPPPAPMPDGERKGPVTASDDQTGRAREADTSLGAAAAADPCSSACRALASMRRAADRLCQLSGDGDTRCDSARQRVSSAGERVRSFCPSCSVAQE